MIAKSLKLESVVQVNRRGSLLAEVQVRLLSGTWRAVVRKFKMRGYLNAVLVEVITLEVLNKTLFFREHPAFEKYSTVHACQYAVSTSDCWERGRIDALVLFVVFLLC